MEKRIAHYQLSKIKLLVAAGSVRSSRTALKSAVSLGMTFGDMKVVILNLQVQDFYKSMTTQHDHTIWQDVYHYPAEDGDLYIKLQILGDVVIVSFKECER